MRKGLVGSLVGALVVSAAVLASAMAASASTSYAVVSTVNTGSGLTDGLAVDPAHHSVYVVNSNANRVSVIDTTTNLVKATIPVGGEPFRVALDPGLNRAYVTNVTGNSLSVIDTTTNSVVSTITSPRFNTPRGVAVDPTTHLVYVPIYYDNQMLAVIDPTTSPAAITYTDILGSRPWAVDVDPTTHRAYPTTLFGGTLSTVSGTAILSTIHGLGAPTQVTVDPVTKKAYVANNGNMTVVDISADVPVVTGTLAPGTQHSDLAIDQGVGTSYVTNPGANSVSVMDKASGAISATVPVGSRPSAVEVDPVTHRAHVINSDNTVSVIAPFASQGITFTSDVPATAAIGGTYTATATGGDSGNPVTFSTASPGCTVTPTGAVRFTHAGCCVIVADQAGSSSYTAAATATQTVEVAKTAQAITFTTMPPADATVGGSYPVSATGGGSGEPVTLSVDSAGTDAV
jgi:YVTN family beta-propeller protein